MRGPRHGTHRVVTLAGVAAFEGLRLPPGERWQFYAMDGPVTMRINTLTGGPSGPLEVLAAIGTSQIHVHPGPNVFIEFSGTQGSRALVVVSPTPAPESR